MKTINIFHFALTFLIIGISGNPTLYFHNKEAVYSITLIFLVILWLIKPIKLTRKEIIIISSFSLILLLHILTLGQIVFMSSIGFIVKLAIGLFALKVIPRFSMIYVSVMYTLSIISIICFIPFYLGINMEYIFSPIGFNDFNGTHIGIHYWREEFDGSIRNMGMFWEPGAFAGYLMIALFFLVRDSNYKEIVSKKGMVIILALLTTQSTTGYLAFFVFVLFYVYISGWIKSRAIKFLIVPVLFVLILGSIYAFFNKISFLGEKTSHQYESAVMGEDKSHLNRIGNALYDMDWISEKPLLGWGSNPETRTSVDSNILDIVAGQGNGLTGFVVKYGLVGFGLFIGFFAYNTWRISRSLYVSFFGVFLICLLLIGEQFLNYPIFLSLMFLPRNFAIHR